jgi:plasmid stability protein
VIRDALDIAHEHRRVEAELRRLLRPLVPGAEAQRRVTTLANEAESFGFMPGRARRLAWERYWRESRGVYG